MVGRLLLVEQLLNPILDSNHVSRKSLEEAEVILTLSGAHVTETSSRNANTFSPSRNLARTNPTQTRAA